MAETKVLILRKESAVANTYGLGEEVAPNCVLFRAGFYGLTLEELGRKIAASNSKSLAEMLAGKTSSGETAGQCQ